MTFLIGVVLAAQASGTFTFVRHGETVANATGSYNGRTLNEFSDKGKQEVAELTKQLLAGPRFDTILVSPSPRVLKTIAPYLKAMHQRATIWPLLYECCTGHRPKGAHATRFEYGAKVTIPSDLAPWFTMMPDENRLPNAASYDAGLAQVEASVQEFRANFTKGRVLLVGHSGQGGHFIHALTGKWIKVENAREMAIRY